MRFSSLDYRWIIADAAVFAAGLTRLGKLRRLAYYVWSARYEARRLNWAAAAHRYKKALKCQPDQAQLWVQFGHVQKEMADFENAAQSYQRALLLEPDNLDCWIHYGHLSRHAGRYRDAEYAATRVRSLGFIAEFAPAESDAASDVNSRSGNAVTRPAHVPFYETHRKILHSGGLTQSGLSVGEIRLLSSNPSRDLAGCDGELISTVGDRASSGILLAHGAGISIKVSSLELAHIRILVYNPNVSVPIQLRVTSQVNSASCVGLKQNSETLITSLRLKWVLVQVPTGCISGAEYVSVDLDFEWVGLSQNLQSPQLLAACLTSPINGEDTQWNDVERGIRNYAFPSLTEFRIANYYDRLVANV